MAGSADVVPSGSAPPGSAHLVPAAFGSTPAEADQTRTALSRRRFFGVSGGAFAAGVLAACGSGSDPSRDPSSEHGSSAIAAEPSGSVAAAGNPPGTSVAQWYHQYGEDGTRQAAERYAAGYPAATVTVQWVPGDYDNQVASALQTDSGPDIFEASNGPNIDQIQGGQVVALDGILGADADDFTGSLIDRMTYRGSLYAVPQVIDMQLLVYRKSLLAAAGVSPPTTMKELTAAASELTAGDVKGLFLGNDAGVGVVGGPVLWSAGSNYLLTDDTPGFADPNVAQALNQLHTLFDSGSLLMDAPSDWSDPSALVQGLTAMQWTGLWTIPVLESELGDDFGVLPWPAFSSTVGTPSVPIGAYGSAVSAKSRNPAEARAFVKYLWVDGTADQLDFAQSYGFHIPARKSVAAKADKLKTGAAAKAVSFLQEYGMAQTPLLWTTASAAAYSEALTNIIRNGAEAGAELAKVTAVVTDELARVSK